MIEVEMVKRHGATQCQVKYTKLKENNNDIYRLAKLFNTSYSTERIPEEWGNADICIIYKQKGDYLKCENYSGISLM